MFKKLSAKVKDTLDKRRALAASEGTVAPAGAMSEQQRLVGGPSIDIALVNNTASSTVYAYLTGTDSNNQVFLLSSDGKTLYHPPSPTTAVEAGPQPLSQDVAIKLAGPGSTTTVTCPTYISGGRIWFSVDEKLTFLVNRGPALVEPSINNPTDPNIHIHWAFAELSFNPQQLFANISYVDFVSIPVGMSLTNASGAVQSVPGLKRDALVQICNDLKAQAAADGAPWDKLVVNDAQGNPLRALSPNAYLAVDGSAFASYFNDYVDQVWATYTSTDLTINTQAAWGNVTGRVDPATGNVEFPDSTGTSSFPRPSARDIFGCNSGPFAPGQSPQAMAIVPRLAAAFNRRTLLLDGGAAQPNGVPDPASWYTGSPSNHYSRIVHAAEVDGRGYAFAYDDVVADGGKDVAGTVFDGAPRLLTVTLGGQ